MGGHSTDPQSDPQAVLRQLIRQAEETTVSSNQHTDDDDDDDNEDGFDSGDDGIDSGDDDDQEDTDSSDPCSDIVDDGAPPLSAGDQASQLLSYEQISATLASITADRRELALLSQHKTYLSTAHKRNMKHQRSLERSLHFLSKTREELKSILHSLDIADVVDAEDQSLEVIRSCKHAEDAATACPFRAPMVQQIPLLRLQSIERAEYDNALGSRLWLEFEDAQLRSAVKAIALKSHAIALSMDPDFHGDPLTEAAKLDEVLALRLAEQMDADHKQALAASTSRQGWNVSKGLDWRTIAARVPTRSMEEVKTRWYGVLRPGVNTAAWSQEETEKLIRIATPYLAAHLARLHAEQAQAAAKDASMATPVSSSSQAPVPWQAVARQLGTGRTAHACFVAYCTAIVQHDQPEMTPVEDENLNELFSLFRGAWRFMALHASASPNLSISSLEPASDPTTSSLGSQSERPSSVLGKVGRDAQLLYRRFRNTTDPALATGSWSLDEDLSLIKAVRTLGQDSWASVSARIPGRTSTQARERWSRRLKQVVAIAGPAATDEQIVDLIEGKKKLQWTPQMDALLLSCLDDNWRGKGGQTFAQVASHVSSKVGIQISDKSIRDRVKILSKKASIAAPIRDTKDGTTEESEQEDAREEASTSNAGQSEQPAAPDQAAASKSGNSSSAAPVQLDTSADQAGHHPAKPNPRPRTTILPGAKRRKL